MDAADAAPELTFSRAAFRLALDVGLLSPEQWAAVAARPRFYRMSWLVPAGAATAADDGPLSALTARRPGRRAG